MKLNIKVRVLIVMLVLTFALTGCQNKLSLSNCQKGIHDFGDWQLVLSATCTVDGQSSRTCAKCGRSENGTIRSTHTLEEIPEKVSRRCVVCNTVLVDNTELASMVYESDKSYSITFTQDTSIDVLYELCAKTVKSFDIQLFRNAEYNVDRSFAVTSPMRLDGNNGTLASRADLALEINSKGFTLLDLNIICLGSRFMNINIKASKVEIDNVNVTLPSIGKPSRGISYIADATNSFLTINSSSFLIGDKSFYETDAIFDSQSRGISLYKPQNAKIKITDSEFKGFSYVINMNGAGGFVDASGCEVIVDRSELSGWSSFNIWVSGATIKLTDTKLKGINNLTQGYNSFSIIVINDDIYDMAEGAHASAISLIIEDCSFINYQNKEAAQSVTTESFIRIDNDGISNMTIKNTLFTDTTGKIESVFVSPIMKYEKFVEYLAKKVTYSGITATSIQSGGAVKNIPMIHKLN